MGSVYKTHLTIYVNLMIKPSIMSMYSTTIYVTLMVNPSIMNIYSKKNKNVLVTTNDS